MTYNPNIPVGNIEKQSDGWERIFGKKPKKPLKIKKKRSFKGDLRVSKKRS